MACGNEPGDHGVVTFRNSATIRRTHSSSNKYAVVSSIGTFGSIQFLMLRNKAESAGGSQNGCPGASSADKPPSGATIAAGPRLALMRNARSRPSRSFS